MGTHPLDGDGPPILSYLGNQSKWMDASDQRQKVVIQWGQLSSLTHNTNST